MQASINQRRGNKTMAKKKGLSVVTLLFALMVLAAPLAIFSNYNTLGVYYRSLLPTTFVQEAPISTNPIQQQSSLLTVTNEQQQSPNDVLVGPASWKMKTADNKECSAPEAVKGFLSNEQARLQVQKFVSQAKSIVEHSFKPIGRDLMQAAVDRSTSLLTVQVGGMDGKSGRDPMYKMYYEKSMRNWMPVVFEPVPVNFGNLVKTYQEHETKRSLPCPLLLNQAVAYGQNTTTCSFCHYNVNKPECQNQPDWVKYEIGSLDCVSKQKTRFRECIVEDKLACGPIKQALVQHGLPTNAISFLQVDVEGFEVAVLEGFFSEFEPHEYPPVIHFESKILHSRGRLPAVLEFLKERGYQSFQGRVDTTSLLLE